MLMFILKVTDQNEIIGLNPNTFELWRTTANQGNTDIYRQQMQTEVMPRAYFNQTSGIVFGTLVLA